MMQLCSSSSLFILSLPCMSFITFWFCQQVCFSTSLQFHLSEKKNEKRWTSYTPTTVLASIRQWAVRAEALKSPTSLCRASRVDQSDCNWPTRSRASADQSESLWSIPEKRGRRAGISNPRTAVWTPTAPHYVYGAPANHLKAPLQPGVR